MLQVRKHRYSFALTFAIIFDYNKNKPIKFEAVYTVFIMPFYKTILFSRGRETGTQADRAREISPVLLRKKILTFYSIDLAGFEGRNRIRTPLDVLIKLQREKDREKHGPSGN